MMKKGIIITLIFLITFLVSPSFTYAKTLGDMKSELNALKAEKQAALDKSEALQEQIDGAKAEMAEISRKTAETKKDQQQTKDEIEELDKEIDLKDEEIKDLVAFYQISENENFYLKFIFGAESFEDFIYRFSVAEQLTDANDQLMDEMNDLIKENEKKVKELEKQEKELDDLSDQMKKQVSKLSTERGKYLDSYMSVDEEIAIMEDTIQRYEDVGCSDNEDLATCGGGNVPYDYGFDLPLNSGCITTEFGPNSDYSTGIHKGIDIACNPEGTPVHAVAAGRVVGVLSGSTRLRCGGNVVFINHTVNGKKYTSGYYHLLSINVSVGEIVSKGQQIATVGGGPLAGPDCSTGAHLHLDMVHGHYYVDYMSFNSYLSNVFNPRDMIYFPYG